MTYHDASLYPEDVAYALRMMETGDDESDLAWTNLARRYTWPTANEIWQEACRQYDEKHAD
jgi:hypothetical protein